MIQPVILSGGAGSRLWPLSREEYPKHLIPLIDEQSLLQKTILRLQGIADIASPLVVCNEAQRFMVALQLQQIDCQAAAILLEPFGRNTAPAVALAALKAQEQEEDPLLLVLPADHLIQQAEVFRQVVAQAVPYAMAGHLVTFGVVPTCAHTGYGYIQRGIALSAGAYQVSQFVEKPNQQKAEAYLSSGQYYWNSGMFLFRASAYLKALQTHAPQILSVCQQAMQHQRPDLDFIRIDAEAFVPCPDISLDYAVMEKAETTVVLPLSAEWNDVGSWDSLCEVCPHDAAGNVIHGDVLVSQVSNSYLRAETRLLAAVGVENMVVIETADAVLVTNKQHSQQVKEIVAQLKQQHREERLHHLTHYRPWGQHQLLIAGNGFQVRRVHIQPGKSISLQKHQLRSEHWVIVQGVAEICCNSQIYQLTANQSFYVAKNQMHSIRNIGDGELEFIEVQVGACMKEDDVERED